MEQRDNNKERSTPLFLDQKRIITNIGASVMSSAMSVLILHPMASLQTRFQVMNKGNTTYNYSSIKHALLDIHQKEGIRALYQGMVPSLVGNTLAWSCYFVFYNELKEMIKTEKREKLSMSQNAFCSAAAGMITAVITNPVWLIRTRMQIQLLNNPNRYTSMFQAGRTIIKEEGIRGLYRGLVASFFGVSHGVVQFAVLEEINHIFRMQNQHDDLHTWQSVFSGGFSKIFATMTTYPYQVVKSRIQMRPVITSNGEVQQVYQGIQHVILDTWRTEGIRGFYRGCIISLIRVVPSSAITVGLYYQFFQFLGNAFN